MFSKKDYETFRDELEPIIVDCVVTNPSKEKFHQNKYFLNRGVWPGTEKEVFAYDIETVDSYMDQLLALSKRIPLFEKPKPGNAGTLIALDLLTDFRKEPTSDDDLLDQIELANHFMNLLAASRIAEVYQVDTNTSSKTAIMILNEKYRSFFSPEDQEPEGQEPADD